MKENAKALNAGKFFAMSLLAALLIFTMGSCGKTKSENESAKNDYGTKSVEIDEEKVSETPKDTIEIKEKMFVTQMNDIYINTEDYIGKTLKFEGAFDIYKFPVSGETYYSVLRNGPGCCGNDSKVGLEVAWDKEYPSKNEWVEAIGVLKQYEENGAEYLQLQLSSLRTLTERGADYVKH